MIRADALAPPKGFFPRLTRPYLNVFRNPHSNQNRRMANFDGYIAPSTKNQAMKTPTEDGDSFECRGMSSNPPSLGSALRLSAAELKAVAKSPEAQAIGWRDLPGGVRIKQVRSVWVKEVNPNSSGFARWWGRGALDAQSRGLDMLADLAPSHVYSDGRLITSDAGAYTPGKFWGTWLKGSKRLGTPFNDIRPWNIGANGIIFDPVEHPALQTLQAVIAVLIVGAIIVVGRRQSCVRQGQKVAPGAVIALTLLLGAIAYGVRRPPRSIACRPGPRRSSRRRN